MGNISMNLDELKEMIKIEYSYLDIDVSELKSIHSVVADNEPSNTQKAATSQFISEFYNGTENILKRICKYKNVQIPSGGQSHTELFQLFSINTSQPLPVLFDELIIDDYRNIRKFRHYIIHGYAFQIEWNLIKNSIANIDSVYEHFKNNVKKFMNSIQN